MKHDCELLELAAKAAGYRLTFKWRGNGSDTLSYREREVPRIDNQSGAEYGTIDWNPLADDGDALRLAVKLGIDVSQAQIDYWDKHSIDPCAATRRAIVRAAAEIGRAME